MNEAGTYDEEKIISTFITGTVISAITACSGNFLLSAGVD